MFLRGAFRYFRPSPLIFFDLKAPLSSATPITSEHNGPTNYAALSTVVTVFFFWGFIAAGNSIFIPFCKHYFSLDQFQSQLIDFAFYGGYFLGALALFAFGVWRKSDLVGSWGYRAAIVYGLLVSALGAITMIAAVQANTFPGMLLGLFIVALGFALQQTAAQPFLINLGKSETGAARVNLGGGVNSFGTAIGPLVVGFALFGTTAAITEEQIRALPLGKVIWLYALVGVLFILAAALFFFSKKLPSGKIATPANPSSKALILMVLLALVLIAAFAPVFWSYRTAFIEARSAADLEGYRFRWLLAAFLGLMSILLVGHLIAKKGAAGWGALKYPQLVLGMVAIFVYVGMEVSIVSNLGELLAQPAFGNFEASQVAPFVAMYWGSMMIGRWTGALAAFELKKPTKNWLTVLVPLIAFAVVLGVIKISGYQVGHLYIYILVVFVQIGAFFISKDQPARMLGLFGVLGFAAMLVGMFTTGNVAVLAFISGGLFCSIMWPAIFNLALTGLGNLVPQGSSFLVMMILGGAIIPPIQGKLADYLQAGSSVAGMGIHQSYWVAAFCFAYITYYAIYMRRSLRKL